MSDIDLHTHSTASDGTLSPAEIVALAKDSGLAAIALTDHDTTEGLPEAIQAGHDLAVEVVPGCELSVDFAGGMMHILGLWLPEHPRSLRAVLQDLRDKRDSRNERMLAQLQAHNVDISLEEVRALSGDGSMGRPHMAQVLVQRGFAADIDDAFQRYIGPKGIAYVPKDKLTPEKAIDALRNEEATVILAHPYSLNLGPQELDKEISQLKALGLDGIEAYYPEHDPETTRYFETLAERHNLLLSGGSDFHGDVKPDIRLGHGKNNLALTYDLLNRMKTARQARGQWVTHACA